MSIDAIDAGAVMQVYEERFLFLLLLLRQPRARLIYVTSRTILPSIIDLLPRSSSRRHLEPSAAAAFPAFTDGWFSASAQ